MTQANLLGRVYARWIQSQSERAFEKWLRTQIVNASQTLTVSQRAKLLNPKRAGSPTS